MSTQVDVVVEVVVELDTCSYPSDTPTIEKVSEHIYSEY